MVDYLIQTKFNHIMTKQNPIIKVKRIVPVAFWSVLAKTQCCAICRVHVLTMCLECTNKDPCESDSECKVAVGQCEHAFHLHCIKRWLYSNKTCPLDAQPWVYIKIINNE